MDKNTTFFLIAQKKKTEAPLKRNASAFTVVVPDAVSHSKTPQLLFIKNVEPPHCDGSTVYLLYSIFYKR